MKILGEYTGHSRLESSLEGASLFLANNLLRPMRFRGVIRRSLFPLRLALRSFGMIFWGDLLPSSLCDPLEPFLTVLPDRLILEGFQSSGSTYAALLIDTKIFDIKDETLCGTSQVHFPPQLWKDVEELRSSRETTLVIGEEGCSEAARRQPATRIRESEFPARFLARFLLFQECLGKPSVRLEIAPADLIKILDHKGPAERFVDANACRLEIDSGGQPRIVMEPWENSYRLTGQPKGIPWESSVRIPGEFRNWHILNELAPYVDSAHLQFSDRDGPLFCWVKWGPITLVLGIGDRIWSINSAALPMIIPDDSSLLTENLRERAHQHLRTVQSATAGRLAKSLAIDDETASKLLTRLCRAGHGFFDVQSRVYRHRELFTAPLPESTLFQESAQAEAAMRQWTSNLVKIHLCFPQILTRKGPLKLPAHLPRRKRLDRQWHVHGQVADFPDVRIVVNQNGSIASGLCNCPFYEENLMKAGPCQHMTALLLASAADRPDLPSSIPIGGAITH